MLFYMELGEIFSPHSYILQNIIFPIIFKGNNSVKNFKIRSYDLRKK